MLLYNLNIYTEAAQWRESERDKIVLRQPKYMFRRSSFPFGGGTTRGERDERCIMFYVYW